MQLRKQVETIILAKHPTEENPSHSHNPNQNKATGGGDASTQLDSKDNLSTKRPDKLPPLKEGDNVVIDRRAGVITKIASRMNQRSIPADKLGDPSTSKPYKTTSIQISGGGAQLSTHRFGGIDYEIAQDRAVRAQTKGDDVTELADTPKGRVRVGDFVGVDTRAVAQGGKVIGITADEGKLVVQDNNDASKISEHFPEQVIDIKQSPANAALRNGQRNYDKHLEELREKQTYLHGEYERNGDEYPNFSQIERSALLSEEMRGIKEGKALADDSKKLQGRIDDLREYMDNLDAKIHHPHRTNMQRNRDKRAMEEKRAVMAGLKRVQDEHYPKAQ